MLFCTSYQQWIMRTVGLWVLTPLTLLASPNIQFQNTNFEFGTISQGQVVETTFAFENKGSSDLSILGTHASCGCTSVLESPNKVYRKGQKGTLRVQFDSKGFQGQITKAITVMTNEKVKPMRLLTISGNVKSGIATTPEVLDFAKVYTSKPKSLPLVVTTHLGGLNDLRLIFDTELVQVTKVKTSDKKWELKVTPAENILAGKHKTRLQLSDPLREGSLEIPIFLDVQADFHATQSELVFGRVSPGQSKSVSLRLKGKSLNKLRDPVVKLYINGKGVARSSSFIEVQKNKARAGEVDYKFSISNPERKKGALHGEVAFKQSGKDGHLVIPIQGYFF
jgi:hypothetical protein